MASGYEKSKDYGGPEPSWSELLMAGIALEVAIDAYLLLRLFLAWLPVRAAPFRRRFRRFNFACFEQRPFDGFFCLLLANALKGSFQSLNVLRNVFRGVVVRFTR
jgi:hypothetical protein